MHGTGTRKRVDAGTRQDPAKAGTEQAVKNLKHGRYALALLAKESALADQMQRHIEEAKVDGPTFHGEIGVMRYCLDRLLENYGASADQLSIGFIRDSALAIIRASESQSRAEKGVRISLEDGVLPMLEEIGQLVRECVEKFVREPECKSGFLTQFKSGVARSLRNRTLAGLSGAGSETGPSD